MVSQYLILNKEYIYISGDKLEPVLCYCPGYGESFSAGLSSLLQDLLGMVDSNDHQAVVVAYALYQSSIRPNASIRDLISVMTNAETGNEQKTEFKETIRYENGLKIASITGVEDTRPPAVDDMDAFYEALAETKPQPAKKQPAAEKNKHKMGIKFLR